MNLATRCSACGTAFRVVRDQLRVSEGWVRCGRCHAVFNASDDLFELDDDAQTTAADDSARRVLDEIEGERRRAQTQPIAPAWTLPAAAAPDLDDEVDESCAVAPPPDDAPAGDRVDEVAPPAPGAFEVLDLGAADDGRPAAIVAWSGQLPQAAIAAPADQSAAVQDDAPAFVRRADRLAFWRSARMRAVLGLGAAVLALALVAQIGQAARDTLAAHWSALTPALAALCGVTGCRVQPLRRIELLSVDSAGLTRIEGAPLYRLQVVLHNRADTALAAPALDLSLEDAQGALLARRVLQGAELGLTSPVIAAGAQLPITLTLAAREHRIAGYHVELFYP